MNNHDIKIKFMQAKSVFKIMNQNQGGAMKIIAPTALVWDSSWRRTFHANFTFYI
jgi:hypothetical protein